MGGGLCEQGVGLCEQGDEFADAGHAGDGFEVDVLGVGGVFAGEPMAAVTEEVVAHFGVFPHIEGVDEIAKPEDDGDVDLAGGEFPGGDGE